MKSFLFRISLIGDVHLIFCDLITRMFTGLVLFLAGPILRSFSNATPCSDGARPHPTKAFLVTTPFKKSKDSYRTFGCLTLDGNLYRTCTDQDAKDFYEIIRI